VSAFERAVMMSLLDLLEHDEVSIRDIAERTELSLEYLLDCFSGVSSMTLSEIESICRLLRVNPAETIGSVIF
jgi:AraC-like DNA-binding protein